MKRKNEEKNRFLTTERVYSHRWLILCLFFLNFILTNVYPINVGNIKQKALYCISIFFFFGQGNDGFDQQNDSISPRNDLNEEERSNFGKRSNESIFRVSYKIK